MPAPVEFTLSLAPLDVNFEGSLQDFATAIVDRLTITPSEPWSSFQNGGAIPSSDVGPVLYQGKEWRVFDSDTGAYTYHRQHGSGLIDATLPLSKVVVGTAGSVLAYNGDGNLSEIPIGTAGYVLTSVGGAPAWAVIPPRPTMKYFEATRTTTNQALETDGASPQIVAFNGVNKQSGVTFDTTNYRVPVAAGELWHFYCYLQIEDELTASTDVQIVIDVRVNGITSSGFSGLRNYNTAQDRDGFGTSGIIPITEDGFVDVALTVLQGTPESGSLEIAANQQNTRFGGYRII